MLDPQITTVLFDLDGKGYWMMYQDAETGKNVRLSQK